MDKQSFDQMVNESAREAFDEFCLAHGISPSVAERIPKQVMDDLFSPQGLFEAFPAHLLSVSESIIKGMLKQGFLEQLEIASDLFHQRN